MSPFIIQTQSSVFVAADGQLLLEMTEKGICESLVALLATDYVFNIKYTSEVLPSYLFFQSFLLESSDYATDGNKRLANFLVEFNRKLSSDDKVKSVP
jgi:hypothetical protein